MFENAERNPTEQIPCIDDLDEAREFIHERFEAGERPVVTVPQEYADALQNGLKPHATWIPGLEVIAGTIGRKPYLPRDGGRTIVEVDVPEQQIKPRFTGPQRAFQGIVILEGPIGPEQITIH